MWVWVYVAGSFFVSLFWDRFLLCCPRFEPMGNPPASWPQLLELQAWVTTPSLSLITLYSHIYNLTELSEELIVSHKQKLWGSKCLPKPSDYEIPGAQRMYTEPSLAWHCFMAPSCQCILCAHEQATLVPWFLFHRRHTEAILKALTIYHFMVCFRYFLLKSGSNWFSKSEGWGL